MLAFGAQKSSRVQTCQTGKQPKQQIPKIVGVVNNPSMLDALRVSPAETRLTVYRRRQVYNTFSLVLALQQESARLLAGPEASGTKFKA